MAQGLYGRKCLLTSTYIGSPVTTRSETPDTLLGPMARSEIFESMPSATCESVSHGKLLTRHMACESCEKVILGGFGR